MPVKSLLFTKEILQEIKAPEAKRDLYKDSKEKGKTYAMLSQILLKTLTRSHIITVKNFDNIPVLS